ncbi:LysR substrate-binding domain-containing protein [Microbacterium sp.]|uniref:LysR substrate-binding domain-containing protein n=1 Tax=Microbacterium sp. TaxID=51671 RepID=UPI00356747B7
MEIAQLRAIRELGERGSIAAVAAARRVTPSSISQQIAALQRQSSTPLTYKRGGRTVLTLSGQALADAAVDVEVAMTRARETLARFPDEAGGAVAVAAFHSAGLALFGRLLAATADTGGPTLALSDFDVAQAEFPSLATDHDLVIAHRLAGSRAWSASVQVQPLFFEPLDIAVRRDHPLASERVIRASQLRGVDWVAVHEGFPLEQALAVIATISGQSAAVSHRINDFLIAADVVASSGSIALMPRFTTDPRHRPDVVLRPLDVPGIGRYVDCLARPEALERRATRTVLDHIQRIAAGLSSRGAE